MAWKATAYVSDLSHSPNGEPVTRSEKLVMFVLSDYFNKQECQAWPSVPTIAAEALMSEHQARKTLHSLERKGVIRIVRRRDSAGDWGTNAYTFCELPSVSAEEESGGGVGKIIAHGVGKEIAHGGQLLEGGWATFGTAYKEEPRLEPRIEPRNSLPTEAEICAYMGTQGIENPADMAKRFMAYYETRGWVPNGQTTKMKSWRAAVRTWKQRERPPTPASRSADQRNGTTRGTEEEVESLPEKSFEKVFLAPSWMPLDAWMGYVEMRRKIRRPLTMRAMNMACEGLKKFRDDGQDITAILNQSTFNSWQGLFPVNTGGNGNGRFLNKAEQRSASNKTAILSAIEQSENRDRDLVVSAIREQEERERKQAESQKAWRAEVIDLVITRLKNGSSLEKCKDLIKMFDRRMLEEVTAFASSLKSDSMGSALTNHSQ